MNRLLLLVLLASATPSALLDDAGDLRNLEDLEDLFRDEQMRGYSDPTKDRTPDALLHQFNSAKRSPVNRRKLVRYLRMLEQEEQLFSLLSQDEIEGRMEKIQEILENRATCESTTPEYRTIDGTCNNLGKSEQGAAGALLLRVLTNAYDDGSSKPRTVSVTGRELPSARQVSLGVFDNKKRTDGDFTTLAMHFGQQTDHDITAVHSQNVNCSSCSVAGECFSILLDESDPVFGTRDPPCFAFRRSSYEDDSAGVRQHINSITSYLDASFVYGSDDTTADELTKDTGSLEHQTDKVTDRELLPPDVDLVGCAGVNETAGIYCGRAGDSRAAEQPGLTSLHTLFMREHNRIAEQLRTLSPTLSADDVYQKARKILGAEWQHIVYNEYLPLIIGKDLYESKNLAPNASYAYDSGVDASIANVFAAAAFRFGHTQVPSILSPMNKNYKARIPQILMKEAFFNATYMHDESIADGAVDSILRGMTTQNLFVVDGHFSDAITDNLFGDPAVVGDGFDLTALNIQRARDHGLPSYATIRKEFCGLSDIESYQTLIDEDIVTRGDFRNLQDTYGVDGVKDIDAFVGFVLEKHLTNTLVGPTLACIFADQFYRLKFGDRFFYKNPDQFTQAQMDEIEKATMARLMCDNVEAVSEIQPFLFIAPKNFGGSVNAHQQQQRDNGLYHSFYEYSRSGNWPHKRRTVLDLFDNRRVDCAASAGNIPVVDMSKFI